MKSPSTPTTYSPPPRNPPPTAYGSTYSYPPQSHPTASPPPVYNPQGYSPIYYQDEHSGIYIPKVPVHVQRSQQTTYYTRYGHEAGVGTDNATTVVFQNTKMEENYDAHVGLYSAFGFIVAILLGVFGFLFLCCAEATGIGGKRRRGFLLGCIVGNVINVVMWILLYLFALRTLSSIDFDVDRGVAN